LDEFGKYPIQLGGLNKLVLKWWMSFCWTIFMYE
jgi:hypothetical protein